LLNDFAMLQRLYVHNFRCLENFTLDLRNMPTALLIGKNGAGKSTLRATLEIFQNIGRGINRVGHLARLTDFTHGRSNLPIRFEFEAVLDGKVYLYKLALELPEKFRELRVAEESLTVQGEPIYSREQAQVTLFSSPLNRDAQFLADWHLVALPIIQEQSPTDPLRIFKSWLARMILLNPFPPKMNGESRGDTVEPELDGSNIGDWLTGLLGQYPAAYTDIDSQLRKLMPDIREFQNEIIGKNARELRVCFEQDSAQFNVGFRNLSAGEKCFFLGAAVLAANRRHGPVVCFWDEPDNYLAPSEVGHFVMDLRRAFRAGGQFLATSHNQEAIRQFSDENTFVLGRRSHLEPTLIRPLREIQLEGDLTSALLTGDVEA